MPAPFFDNCATAEDHNKHTETTCANCGAHLFETNEFLSFMEGKIIWSHLEDTKCDDPKPIEENSNVQ